MKSAAEVGEVGEKLVDLNNREEREWRVVEGRVAIYCQPPQDKERR